MPSSKPKQQPVSVYQDDITSVAEIIKQVQVIGHGDVFAAPGTRVKLFNGNGYDVGDLVLDPDSEQWVLYPHQDGGA